MRWSELEDAQPRLGELGRGRLLGPGVVLVATIRRDGTPRLSPVEPFVLDGDLWLSMLWNSTKAADLQRDPRMLVHSIVTGRDGGEGEFKLRGTARAEHDAGVRRRYAEAVTAGLGWTPTAERFHLFAVDFAEVTFIRYDDATGDQHVARWPPAREFVRRGDGGTSLHEPEPVREILGAGQATVIDYAAPGPLTGLASVSPPALDLPGDRFAENQLRPAAALAGALLALEPAALDVPRRPDQRVIGTCRHFAVLSCALLRYRGVTARARCGFAT